MAQINQAKMDTERANQALLAAEQREKNASASEKEEKAANLAADTDKKVSENQSVMLDNRMKALEQIQKKLELGYRPTENDALLVFGSTDIILDDMADSVQERQEFERAIMGQMEALRLLQTTQQQAPIARSPEQSVQAIQLQDAGLTNF